MTLPRADLAIHLGALARMGLLDMLLAIAQGHHVLLDDVLSSNKSKQVMAARTACYLHLRGLNMSYPEIGRVMLRDHTTILYAVKKHNERAAAPEGSPSHNQPRARRTASS